jgi:hypothetical protein
VAFIDQLATQGEKKKKTKQNTAYNNKIKKHSVFLRFYVYREKKR